MMRGGGGGFETRKGAPGGEGLELPLLTGPALQLLGLARPGVGSG